MSVLWKTILQIEEIETSHTLGGTVDVVIVWLLWNKQVYLHQDKKKAEAESKNCHAKTMLSLEKPKLIMAVNVNCFFLKIKKSEPLGNGDQV